MVKLHFNETSLRHIAQYRSADREGRLLYRRSKDSYRERWFRLCGNLLFYFRTNELGAVVELSDPIGVLVMASCKVQMEAFGDRPFVFSIIFGGEEGRKHFFSGQSQQQCLQWVQALCQSSYSDLRTQMESLRLQVEKLTGADPLMEKGKVHKVPRPLPVVETADTITSATFYVDSAAVKQPGAKFPTADALLPTRQAPNRPLKKPQQLVQLWEPATTKSNTKDSTDMKESTFSNWETFSNL